MVGLLRLKENKLSSLVKRIAESQWFLAFLSVFVFISWYSKWIVAGFAVLSLIACVIILTQRDLKSLIAVVVYVNFLPYYNMGMDMTTSHIIGIVCVCLPFIVSLILYLVTHFKVEKNEFKIGELFWALLIVAVVCLLAGIGCTDYDMRYTWSVLGFFIAMFIGYFLLLNTTDESAKDYVCKVFIAMGIFFVFQEMATYYMTGDVVVAFHNKLLLPGWAMSNSFASMMALVLPFFVYYATKNFPQIFIPLTFIIYIGILFTFSRGNILFVTLLMPFLLLFGFTKAKKKILYVLSLMVTILSLGILFMSLESKILEWFGVTIDLGLNDNGRIAIWEYAMNDFMDNKVFGAGFFGEDGVELFGNLKKFHSTPLQILASCGIIGLIGFVIHYFLRYKLMLTKLSTFKIFALFALATYELYGLIDINLLRYYESMMLLLIFVMAEKETTATADYLFKQRVLIKGVSKMKQEKKKKEKHWLYRHFFKRFFDILLSGIALIVLSPVLLVLTIIVRVKHGSPVLFKQPRPGKNNKLFKFCKYRSMTNARDENGALLPDDQRITKFGKMLRKTSLDELPQLWNIFKGDMSIVGPRPKLVQDMVFYNEEQNRRSEVRPGLTGLAQANGRNLNSWKETFEYDIYYVENCSLWLDIKIIFKTAMKIIKKAEITDTNATADHYHFGKHLLNNNAITQEEYDAKIELAKKMMEENHFKSDINTVNQNKVV